MRKIFCVRVYDEDGMIVGSVVGDALYVATSLRPSFDPEEIPYAFYEKLRRGSLVCSDRTAIESDGSIADFEWYLNSDALPSLKVEALLSFGDDRAAADWFEVRWLESVEEGQARANDDEECDDDD